MAPYAVTTPRLVITPRQGPKQAWGGALEAFKECGLPAGAKMRNLALGFSVPERVVNSEKHDIPALIETIQQFVFQRRLRVKDSFGDFDQLRCGRCTRQQFMRGVNTTIPSIRKDQLEALADHYTEEGVHVQRPQVVGYTRFVAEIEEVFTIAHLEKQPTRVVPRAGSALQNGFRPVSVGVQNEEALVRDILQKIALLCKTRGIIFLSCFQDCDRSDSISLVTPRYSGKATPAQFRQHFPLIRDFSEFEIKLLAKRYTTSSGDINYQALDVDIKEAESQVPPASVDRRADSARGEIPHTPGSKKPTRRISSERSKRESSLKQTRESMDIMERLRAIVRERSLRLADCFVDFDKLRKGVCTMNQLRTVFTVMGIQLDSRDYKNLGELFCNEDCAVAKFRYREFCDEVCDIRGLNISSWDMELPPTPSTAGMERPGSRIRYKAPLDFAAQERLHELEIWIRNRADVRSLDLKRCFQDFDKVCTGHVTRTQFTRIMDMLQCGLTNKDTDLLCAAFCDTDNGLEFNFIDFCSSIKQREHMEQSLNIFQSSRRPKYFDRSGECISPYAPLDTTPWDGESNMLTVGGVTFS